MYFPWYASCSCSSFFLFCSCMRVFNHSVHMLEIFQEIVNEQLFYLLFLFHVLYFGQLHFNELVDVTLQNHFLEILDVMYGSSRSIVNMHILNMAIRYFLNNYVSAPCFVQLKPDLNIAVPYFTRLPFTGIGSTCLLDQPLPALDSCVYKGLYRQLCLSSP